VEVWPLPKSQYQFFILPVDRERNAIQPLPSILVIDASNSARTGPVGIGVGAGVEEPHEKEGTQAVKVSTPSASRINTAQNIFMYILYHGLPVHNNLQNIQIYMILRVDFDR